MKMISKISGGLKHFLALTGLLCLAWAKGEPGNDVSYGSSAAIQSQVIAPTGNPTLHSTTNVNGGDAIRWTSYVQSKFPALTASERIVDLPPRHRWVRDSFRSFACATVSWNGNGVAHRMSLWV